jgi:hypothetical protein
LYCLPYLSLFLCGFLIFIQMFVYILFELILLFCGFSSYLSIFSWISLTCF